MPKRKEVFFESLAGGGSLPITKRAPQECDCFKGRVWLDWKTNEKVGYERFFFDEDEGAYYLNSKRLTDAEAKKFDRSTAPLPWIDPRYLLSDGSIRGAVSGYEWCDVCERRKRAKLGRATFQYWIKSPTRRRTYWFQFGPSAPPESESAFIMFKDLFRPRSDGRMTELIIFCLLCFGKYSSVQDCSERALARRFRVSRGRIRSIRLRFRRRLPEIAVRLKSITGS